MATKHQLDDRSSTSKEIVFQLTESYTKHMGMDRKTGDPIHWTDRNDRDPQKSSQMLKNLKEIAVKEGAVEDSEFGSYDHGMRHYDGGITQSIWQTTVLDFGAVGGATAFFMLGKEMLLKWMDNMGGRSVKLKAGDIEVEIKGTNDIDKAFETLERLREFRDPDKNQNSGREYNDA